MSKIAFSRDISDTSTIRDFADVVQSPERLKLLLVLTVADIRAVGPSVWNGWKGQLLRGLYFETEPVVAGGHTQLAARDRIAAAQAAFRAAVADWRAEEVERFVGRHYPDYWLQDRHAQGRRALQARGRRRAGGREARQHLHHRRLHRHHRAFAVRAQPSPPAGAVRRCLRRLRRQHLGRAHLHHPRRLRARHLPARARVRPRRGRAAPGTAHRRDHRRCC